MTDKTYTIEELNQASKELGGSQDVYFGRLIKQADKNRVVKEGTGFTEEQVRHVVAGRALQGGYSLELAGKFAGDVIKRLREPETVPPPVEGGVYKSPAGVLYRRNNGFWERFGTSMVLNDDELNYPVSEMERVL